MPSRVTRASLGSSVTAPHCSAGCDLPARPADQRAQPREHFLHPERLGDVVVRALVDAVHLLVPAAARGQDQHRDAETCGAPAAEHRQAVDAGEPQVEHDRVIAFGAREEVGPLAVGRAVDRVAGAGQRAGELLRQ